MYRIDSRVCRAMADRGRCPVLRRSRRGRAAVVPRQHPSPVVTTRPRASQKKTARTDGDAMKPTVNAASVREQYELLRREATSGGIGARGHGLALLMMRGVTAWVHA